MRTISFINFHRDSVPAARLIDYRDNSYSINHDYLRKGQASHFGSEFVAKKRFQGDFNINSNGDSNIFSRKYFNILRINHLLFVKALKRLWLIRSQ